jgi:hypothetical protein
VNRVNVYVEEPEGLSIRTYPLKIGDLFEQFERRSRPSVLRLVTEKHVEGPQFGAPKLCEHRLVGCKHESDDVAG